MARDRAIREGQVGLVTNEQISYMPGWYAAERLVERVRAEGGVAENTRDGVVVGPAVWSDWKTISDEELAALG